jgi:hypothetical protein
VCGGTYQQVIDASLVSGASDTLEFATVAAKFVLKVDLPVAAVGDILAMTGCLQDTGTLNWSLYITKNQLTSFGAAAIASKQRLTASPTQPGFSQCLAKTIFFQLGRTETGAPSPQLCGARFSYDATGDTFYVAYGATTQSICTDLAGALPRH